LSIVSGKHMGAITRRVDDQVERGQRHQKALRRRSAGSVRCDARLAQLNRVDLVGQGDGVTAFVAPSHAGAVGCDPPGKGLVVDAVRLDASLGTW
jgi:hypothetical protein